MKTKTKMIFSAALAAALIALPRAQAATSGVVATNAPAAATATNSKPADIMAALFGDPVIAKGKGFEIKQSQLDVVMDAFKAKTAQMGQTVPPEELTKTALNSLIVNQILVQMATDADKAVGKKEADQYIAQIVKQFGSQAAVEQQLKAVGKTFDDWRTERIEQYTATAVMIRELNATPTEAAIQKFYETNSTASELPEQVHVRHILLLTIDPTSPTHAPLSDDQIKAKKKQIGDILKRARTGEDFAALAKLYSEDPNSKDNGGELPPLTREQMGPEMSAAVLSMTNHQVSDVIEMAYGYELIQLLDKTPARKLALTDKLPSSDLTLADYFKDRLTGQKLQEAAPAYIEKLSKSPGVEILDPALKALVSASTNAPVALPTK
jgi:parvulin-like peptidyl-prolyl isomerase